MEQSAAPQQPKEVIVLNQILNISGNMTGWLKFLGVMLIIAGALYAITIVGIIIAWLPIWQGVLLLQAGNRATLASSMRNPADLVIMMDKLRLFFLIFGILMIISIALAILSVVFFGAFFSTFMENIPQYQY